MAILHLLDLRESERERKRERLKMWKKFWIEIDVKGVREHEEKADARTHVSVPVPLFLKILLVFCEWK